MKDILLVAPTEGIFAHAQRAAAQYGFHRVEVRFGVLSEGVRAAGEFVEAGGRIIVSRGGTSRMIQERFKIPVVEIEVGIGDCIAAYKKLRPGRNTVGVIGFNNVISGFQELASVCGRTFRFREIQDEADIPEAINSFREEGIRQFIGDVIVERVPRELRRDGVIIDSELESVVAAMREAERILDVAQRQIERSRELQAVMNGIRDGVVYFDAGGAVRWVNGAAGRMFPSLRPGDPIRDLLGPEDIVPEEGRLCTVGGEKYMACVNPVGLGEKADGMVASFQPSEKISSLEHSLRKSLRKSGFEARYTFRDIVRASAAMDRAIERAKRFAAVDAPILVTGETGTGKELLCQSIHNWSARRGELFIAVNCAAIAPSLMEAEFFGYADGAFTGAKRSGKAGIFELAHGGTLLLDEISELSIELQGRLLRVLQEKQVMRLGDEKLIPVDVRLICSTNRDLQALVREGLFRADLYFRIAVLKLYSPSLAERREDILPLARHFLRVYTEKYRMAPLEMGPEVQERLAARAYAGNIRELKHLMEEAVVLGSFENILSERRELLPASIPEPAEPLSRHTLRYIRQVYASVGENAQEASRILGISRSTLWRKLREDSK